MTVQSLLDFETMGYVEVSVELCGTACAWTPPLQIALVDAPDPPHCTPNSTVTSVPENAVCCRTFIFGYLRKSIKSLRSLEEIITFTK